MVEVDQVPTNSTTLHWHPCPRISGMLCWMDEAVLGECAITCGYLEEWLVELVMMLAGQWWMRVRLSQVLKKELLIRHKQYLPTQVRSGMASGRGHKIFFILLFCSINRQKQWMLHIKGTILQETTEINSNHCCWTFQISSVWGKTLL